MAALDGDEYITPCPLTIKQFPWHLQIQAAPPEPDEELKPVYSDASVPPSAVRFTPAALQMDGTRKVQKLIRLKCGVRTGPKSSLSQ